MAHYEVIEEGDGGNGNQDEEQERYLVQVTENHSNRKHAEEGVSGDEEEYQYYSRQRKPKQLSSEVWTKFTILSRKHYIASCNICGAKLSFKTTTSNLKKHIQRKHNYDITKSCVTPYQPKHKARASTGTLKHKLTELGGLDGLVLNVVADEGENPIVGEEVDVSEVRDGVHDYCVVNEEGQDNAEKSTVSESKTTDRIERVKRNRVVDMQLECLKIKKYNMQMEALVLEQQLNLPRSIYTENLRGCDKVTRGTQTDVGGSSTKVFYVKDNQGSGSHHLFSFQSQASFQD